MKRLALVFLMLCVPSFAQVTIQTVFPVPPGHSDWPRCAGNRTEWELQVSFSQSFGSPGGVLRTKRPAAYSLLRLDIGHVIPITSVCIPTNGSEKDESIAVLVLSRPVQSSTSYLLIANGLQFGNEALATPLTAPVSLAQKEPPATKLVEATDKEDANSYVDGLLTTAKGARPLWSTDIKFMYPIPFSALGRVHEVGPLFEFTGTNDVEQDPDTMKVGGTLLSPLVQKGFSLRGLNLQGVSLSQDVVLESTRDWQNRNVLWKPKGLILLRPWFFYLTPGFGIEAGKNLKSPVIEGNGKRVFRLFAAATAHRHISIERKYLEAVQFDVTYERRYLRREEVFFEENEDKTLSPLRFDQSRRDWYQAKVTLLVRDFFGFTVTHENGEEPPAYKSVNHRVKFGITLKAKTGS